MDDAFLELSEQESEEPTWGREQEIADYVDSCNPDPWVKEWHENNNPRKNWGDFSDEEINALLEEM